MFEAWSLTLAVISLRMTAIESEVGAVRAFNRFHTRWAGALNETLMTTEHSLTEARVLFELARREATPTSELRAELAMDSGHLSRVLDALERRGLVFRRAAEDDARRRDVRLTEAGAAAAAELDRLATEQVGGRLAAVDPESRARLIDAMATVRGTLDERPPPAVFIRGPRAGELGWIVSAHGAVYEGEYGWNQEFEALVARIVGDFADGTDPARERAFIAEVDGAPAGCVLCVRRDDDTAVLRLLLVTPRARGLGVGARLVDACVGFAREAGYSNLVLWTNDVLVHARPIYERAGFRLVGSKAHTSFGHDLIGQDWELDLKERA